MAYNLAVKEMLLYHDNVHSLGILEREESKATRAAGTAVTHDCAFHNFTELFEVLSQRFWRQSQPRCALTQTEAFQTYGRLSPNSIRR